MAKTNTEGLSKVKLATKTETRQTEMKDIVRLFRQIKPEYEWNPDIFSDDSPRVDLLKEILNTKLDTVEQTLIILYAECQSYREMARILNLSHMTCRQEVIRIRKKVVAEFNILSALRGLDINKP